MKKWLSAVLAALLLACFAASAEGFDFAFDDEGYTGEWVSLEGLDLQFCLPDGWAALEPELGAAFSAVSGDAAARLDVSLELEDVFSLKLEIDGAGTESEVLVAVGHDADEDGDLSFEEASFVFGCDCGERYLVNHRTGQVFTGMGDTVAINHRYFDPAWNLAKFVKRGEGAVGETITETVENKRFSIRIR